MIGTWETSESRLTTNVTRICRAIKATTSENVEQIVYYQPGVGTGPTIDDKLFGGALGWGLVENIRAAYGFLANNYCEGDEIFLTGFSRGAFTVRSLAGLIQHVGLLTKRGMDGFYDVLQDYEHRKDQNDDIPASTPSRQETRAPITIKAIGVWETVGTLGVPHSGLLSFLPGSGTMSKYGWHDTHLLPCMENAFQALALNEHRAPYIPTLWENPMNLKTNLKQTWFPGVHSNVGGGSVYCDRAIADLTLAWMMDQFDGLLEFDQGYIRYVFEQNQEHYRALDISKDWGCGKVYNSMRLVEELAGSHHRTPGATLRVSASTGKPTTQRLQNTNEHIHASVRIRWKQPGLGTDDVGIYYPEGMHGWAVAKEEEGAGWVWEGPGGQERIVEDKLGRFETELVGLFEGVTGDKPAGVGVKAES